MKLFIMPVPAFNSDMEIIAYNLRYKKGDALLRHNETRMEVDGAMNSPALDTLDMVGAEAFTGGLSVFIPVNRISLWSTVIERCATPREKIIILIVGEIPVKDDYIERIKHIKSLGFEIGLYKIIYDEGKEPLFKLADYVLFNIKKEHKLEMDELKSKYPDIKFMATHVNSHEVLREVKDEGFTLFEGKFYNYPVVSGQKDISPLKSNAMQLLNSVRSEDFSMEEVSETVSRDPFLSVSLLQLINSPYIGLSNKVTSIQHAISLLGQIEIRKWVTTAVTLSITSDMPSIITRISLMRAKFAENLAPLFNMDHEADSLFLMGLFSVLNIALEIPMELALKRVGVSDEIYEALVKDAGIYSPVLNLVLSYERAEWEVSSRILIIHKIAVEDVYNAYIDACMWYGDLINPKT